jgi:hypothetical protein
MTDNFSSNPKSSHWEALHHRSQVVSSDPITKALLDLKNQVEILQTEPSPSDHQVRSKQFDQIQLIETMIDKVNKLMNLVAQTCPNDDVRVVTIKAEMQGLYSALKHLRRLILS